MVSVLVFLLCYTIAPGDVFLSDNGQGWEQRHVVTPAPQRDTNRERRDWLECQSVPDECEGLVVTQADYITIRPNIVKQRQLTITSNVATLRERYKVRKKKNLENSR